MVFILLKIYMKKQNNNYGGQKHNKIFELAENFNKMEELIKGLAVKNT